MAKRKNDKGKVTIYALACVSALVALVSALLFFSSMRVTETYYVLNQDVPTRTQITPEMLEAVTVSEGGAPPNAIDLGQVQSGAVVAQYSLNKGDILTRSNSGETQDIAVGIPDSWVVTNFGVNADNAVGGRIKRGYYFDIMVATPDGSFYPFINVLALDTTVSLNNAKSSNAADSAEAHSGQTKQYVVGMTPADAAKLQSLVQKYGSGKIRLVLSPMQNEYAPPRTADYTGIFNYRDGDAPINLGEGTDRGFTKIDRKADGTPTEQVVSCSAGNSKPSVEDCKTLGTGGVKAEEEQPVEQDNATPPSETAPSTTNN